MNFLEPGKARSPWGAQSPVAGPAEPKLGCVQCGSLLEPGAYGKFALTGKCFNCATIVSEEDKSFDEYEF